ncbi:MAG: HAD-IB family hydrolase [candidate division Zixibacteria bacterium]|nr:HAD-IB family hydrolase [candidate division Zixibacteria bacterium]
MGKGVAIFDVDRTILAKTSTERLFFRYLFTRGELHVSGLLFFLWQFLLHLRRPEWRLIKSNKGYLKGLPVKEIEAGVPVFFDRIIRSRLVAETVARVKKHLQNGEEVFLLSGMPEFLLAHYAKELGVAHYWGTKVAAKDGVFTGRFEGHFPFGPAKAEILRQLAKEQNWDLSRSYAYADHHTDVSFLELVGHPVAANPDEKLRRIAKERGWEIIN